MLRLGFFGVALALVVTAGPKVANAELRALHGLAAFCIHDLKNLAARLSPAERVTLLQLVTKLGG